MPMHGSLPAGAWPVAGGIGGGGGGAGTTTAIGGGGTKPPARAWSEEVFKHPNRLAVRKLLLPRAGEPGLPADRAAGLNQPAAGGGSGSGGSDGSGGGGATGGEEQGAGGERDAAGAGSAATAAGGLWPASRGSDRDRRFVVAVKNGEKADVKRMLDEGIDADCREQGCPALHWAIYYRRIDIALLLVQSGASRDLVDRDNQTALHICLHPRHGLSGLDDDGVVDATKLVSSRPLWPISACPPSSHPAFRLCLCFCGFLRSPLVVASFLLSFSLFSCCFFTFPHSFSCSYFTFSLPF
jgi:hypothetical protein